MPKANDVWDAGDLYEPYVGRWSRLVAREFLEWLAIPPGLDWLDIGCGTGALTHTIVDQASPRSVTSVDASTAFIAYARAHVRGAMVNFQVADAGSLPCEDSSVDVAVAGLVLNFLSDPAAAAAEIARVVRPGGVAAVYVWDYAERMELMRYFWDAAAALDPAAAELDEAFRFRICQPKALMDVFATAQLARTEVRAIEVPTTFRDFNDYWTPFLGGQGPAPGYVISIEEGRRTQLRECIRAKLPVREDGTIHLVARAWAVRGHKRAD